MSAPRSVTLTNKETGEDLHFWSMATACEFLGRSTAYVSVKLMRSDDEEAVITNDQGKEYTFKLGGRGERRDFVDVVASERRKNIPFEERQKFASQLCTTCERAVGYCEWSRNLRPVEGWEAEPTKISHCKRGPHEATHYISDSYRVKKCPLYIRDGKTVKERRRIRQMLEEERRQKGELQGRDQLSETDSGQL